MPPDLEDSQLEDDFYALLNLGINASQEDITNSYRRLSKLFHPDKHLDPKKKKDAEILFNKTKVAYEVLSDPHQRAIYDTVGAKGLQTEGWQIVQRTKSPQEIREEFEQLVKEREERRLQQRTNPKGTLSVGVNATDLFETYDFEGLPIIEISSMSISQSVEAPLTVSDTLTLNGNLSTQNGTGSGNIGCSFKKVTSPKSWIECGLGAGQGLACNLKGFYTISKYSFGTLQTTCQFTDYGISPGLELMMARQMDKRTAGYLTCKAGQTSSVNAMMVHDTETGHFVGGVQIGLRSSFFNLSYSRRLEDKGRIKVAIKVGTFGAVVEYGCDKKISSRSTVGAAMVIGVPSGVTLKLKVNRANQTFIFPILLSEEILPSAVFYGTACPIVGWYILKTCIIDPYHQRKKQRETEKTKETNAEKLAERQKEANIAVSLMQETYRRIKEQESRNGLIILQAIYGNAEEISNISSESLETKDNIFDCTVQLQCLVRDSRLVLPDRPKCNLPGFYDPCIGEDKSLRVDYTFRNITHSITVKDNEILRIPRETF